MADETPEAPPTAHPLVCGSCNLSARFWPMYSFNENGDRPGILFARHALIQCANCNAIYRWIYPEVKGDQDGGWEKTSLLADLEEFRV